MLRIFLLLSFVFSMPAIACLEKPKAIKLSDTSYENDLEVSYGVNCSVGVTLNSTSGHRYYFSKGRGEGKDKFLCVTIDKDKDKDFNKQEYCGEDLKKQASTLNGPLTIRNKVGLAKGTISILDNTIQILSWGAQGGTKSKPYLQFDIVNLDKKWTLKAMQDETTEIGSGILESKECTRSLGGNSSSQDVIDMRGKSFTTAGSGCASGLTVSEYSTEKRKKPTFMIEGQSAE